ncbi:hypothetical protein BH20ACI2_BH20ACI2_28440 [soil metagenome]
MGYVIIELPSRIKRRYELSDADQIESILDVLDRNASRLKDSPDYFLTAEDILDINAAKAAKTEKGSIPWDTVKAELGL